MDAAAAAAAAASARSDRADRVAETFTLTKSDPVRRARVRTLSVF